MQKMFCRPKTSECRTSLNRTSVKTSFSPVTVVAGTVHGHRGEMTRQTNQLSFVFICDFVRAGAWPLVTRSGILLMVILQTSVCDLVILHCKPTPQGQESLQFIFSVPLWVGWRRPSECLFLSSSSKGWAQASTQSHLGTTQLVALLYWQATNLTAP